jgi:hypothetical protein
MNILYIDHCVSSGADIIEENNFFFRNSIDIFVIQFLKYLLSTGNKYSFCSLIKGNGA